MRFLVVVFSTSLFSVFLQCLRTLQYPWTESITFKHVTLKMNNSASPRAVREQYILYQVIVLQKVNLKQKTSLSVERQCSDLLLKAGYISKMQPNKPQSTKIWCVFNTLNLQLAQKTCMTCLTCCNTSKALTSLLLLGHFVPSFYLLSL